MPVNFGPQSRAHGAQIVRCRHTPSATEVVAGTPTQAPARALPSPLALPTGGSSWHGSHENSQLFSSSSLTLWLSLSPSRSLQPPYLILRQASLIPHPPRSSLENQFMDRADAADPQGWHAHGCAAPAGLARDQCYYTRLPPVSATSTPPRFCRVPALASWAKLHSSTCLVAQLLEADPTQSHLTSPEACWLCLQSPYPTSSHYIFSLRDLDTRGKWLMQRAALTAKGPKSLVKHASMT